MGNKAAALVKESVPQSSRRLHQVAPAQTHCVANQPAGHRNNTPPQAIAPVNRTLGASASRSLGNIPVFAPAESFAANAHASPDTQPPIQSRLSSGAANNPTVMGGLGLVGFIADEESGGARPETFLVGQADAGHAPVDAGPADAGPADAGPAHASAVDAGPVDAGPAATAPATTTPATVPPVAHPLRQRPLHPSSKAKPQCTPPMAPLTIGKTIGVVETIAFTVGGGQVANWSANTGYPRAAPAKAPTSGSALEHPVVQNIDEHISDQPTATLDMN